MVDQDLPARSTDANLVDASVQQQEQESQQPSENGQLPRPEPAEVKPVTLPADDEALPDKFDSELAALENAKSADIGTDELPEGKRNGDETHVKNEQKTDISVTPSGEISTSQGEDGNVRKSKTWLNDIEVF